MKNQIIQFILDEYGVKVEQPFKGDDTCVFRNQRNKKWFAIIMRIPALKLGIKSEKMVDIINLKNHPANVSMLKGAKGIYPAYHMNKENWLSIVLDSDIPLGMIFDLIDQSYNIIDKK